MQLLKQTHELQTHNPEFAKDARDFFSGRLSGHIGTWRYSEPNFEGDPVNGMGKWAEFVKNARNGSDYYVTNHEIDIIPSALKFLQTLEDITLIDLGPGSKEALLEKPGQYMKKLNTIRQYVGVDIVPELLERTKLDLAETFPHIHYYGACADFYKDRFTYPLSGTPVMVMFGQTLLNLPIDPFNKDLVEKMLLFRLKRLRLHLSSGYLIVTQDTNLDADSLYKAYMEEADFDLNLLDRVKRDLPTSGFDVSAFDFEPYFVEQTGAAAHTYVLNKNLKCNIAGEAISLNKGQRLFMHNTFKLPAEYFQSIAQKAGYEPITVLTEPENHIALHILKA